MNKENDASSQKLLPEAITAWRIIQKRFAYPVNAIGERILPDDVQAIQLWRRYGIHHYLNRSDLKAFEAACHTEKKPAASTPFSRRTLTILGVLLAGLFFLSGRSHFLHAPHAALLTPVELETYQHLFHSQLTPDLLYPEQNQTDQTELWQFPALALVNHLTKRELDLYERHQPFRQTFQQISDLTGLDAYYFAALFHAESDLRHTIRLRSGQEKLLVSPMNAIGVSQVTRVALNYLDREIEFYQEVISHREQIQQAYQVSGDLEFIGDLAKEVGATFVLSTLAQSGHDEVVGASDLSRKFRHDPLHLNFRGLKNSDDLCVEVARRLDVLQILVGEKVDHKRLRKDAVYAIRVGAAYFYLDYLALSAAFPQFSDAVVLEMTVNSYNAGRGAVLSQVKKYGPDWRRHRFRETQIHWNRFSTTLTSLRTIEQKLLIPRQSENTVAETN